MGLSDFLGGGILKVGAEIIDSVHTSDEERLKVQAVLKKLDLEEMQILDRVFERQSEINLMEAKHKSIFVAGWRPFIGWVCGVALAWNFIVADFVSWTAELVGAEFTPPDLMGTGELLALTTSLLGLGAARSWEKFKGVARSNMGTP